MHADDDGFIAPKMIMRMVGAHDDDLKILIAKKFVIPFESGVIVIRDWKVNNLVRKDWYRPTIYQEEKNHIQSDVSGRYHLVNETTPDSLTQLGSKVVSKEVNNKEFSIEKSKEEIRRKYTRQ